MKVSVKGKQLPSIFMLYDKQDEKYMDRLYTKIGPVKVAFLNLGQRMCGKWWSSSEEERKTHRAFASTRYEIHEFEITRKIK